MATLKTQLNDADVKTFIENQAANEQQKQDSFSLLALMQDCSGFEPKMWGTSIIGFGAYHYKSERSTQEGDWPLVGFSPRKAAISLYVYNACSGQEKLLEQLGKYKMGAACIYVKKLSDINEAVLKKMIKTTIQFLEKKYGKF